MESQENSLSAPVSKRVVNLLGNEVIELLINSNTITLFDIDSTHETKNKTITSTHFYGYKINEIIKEPVLTTQEDLKSFFLGLATYNWAGPVAPCIIEPGFAMAFGNLEGESLLNIFICFRCGKLQFQWGNGKNEIEAYFYGYDILLIILNEVFKESEKVKSIMSQFSIHYDSNEDDLL
ncbi:hypothetical protein [Emticicia fontis]